jgi:hypothetical protein
MGYGRISRRMLVAGLVRNLVCDAEPDSGKPWHDVVIGARSARCSARLLSRRRLTMCGSSCWGPTATSNRAKPAKLLMK